MKFLTQDKLGIVACDNIITNDKCEIVGVVDSNTSFLLGKYNSIKECEIIINKIANAIAECSSGSIYIMPESAWLLLPISELNLPIGIYHKLHKFGFETIREVVEADLNNYNKSKLGISGIGTKSIKIIREAIKKYETNDL